MSSVVGEEAGDDLADHEGDDQPERDPQSPLVGVGADGEAMRMADVGVTGLV